MLIYPNGFLSHKIVRNAKNIQNIVYFLKKDMYTRHIMFIIML